MPKLDGLAECANWQQGGGINYLEANELAVGLLINSNSEIR